MTLNLQVLKLVELPPEREGIGNEHLRPPEAEETRRSS